MKRNTKRKNEGITLIALVITIIVLLILAGVTIAMLMGDNGILTKATEAKEESTIGEEKEKVQLSATGALAKNNGEGITETNLADELTKYIGIRDIDYELTGTGPFVVKYLDSGRSYKVDENGKISEHEDISKYLKVGNYVNYNSTLADKSGTPVEQSKLEYSSPKGSGTSHGNGYNNQTFTATPDIKWRVLDIENEKVKLISEDVIKTNEDKNFIIFGTVGYLYAERELNEICKIYGYGYGADTSQKTQYNYGGPLDGILTGEIIDSGARSVTVEDINKKVGVTEEDCIKLDNNYGNTANPTIDVRYPTISETNGKSKLAGAKNLKNTYYSYNIYYDDDELFEIENIDVQNMIFKGKYWLASRSIASYSTVSNFGVRRVDGPGTNVASSNLCDGSSNTLGESAGSSIQDYAIRAVVTINSDIIDINTDYETEGHWNLK